MIKLLLCIEHFETYCLFSSHAHQFEAMTDAAILSGAVAALKGMFPNATVPQPTEYFIARWGQNPYSYGSYSSIRPNATGGSVYDTLAVPASNNR